MRGVLTGFALYAVVYDHLHVCLALPSVLKSTCKTLQVASRVTAEVQPTQQADHDQACQVFCRGSVQDMNMGEVSGLRMAAPKATVSPAAEVLPAGAPSATTQAADAGGQIVARGVLRPENNSSLIVLSA